MTTAELERLRILQEVQRGFRRQRDAATGLGVSERQLRRLLRGLEEWGAASVPAKKRGKPPNNRISDLRARVWNAVAVTIATSALAIEFERSTALELIELIEIRGACDRCCDARPRDQPGDADLRWSCIETARDILAPSPRGRFELSDSERYFPVSKPDATEK